MASFQTISSGSESGSKVSGERFCNVCGKACVVRLSQSPSNPNREYYSCPVRREEGGHEWMSWAAEKRPEKDNMVEHLINKVAYCEAKLQFADEVPRIERQRFVMLRGEYEKEKRKMNYLKWCVQAILLCCFVYFMAGKKVA